MKEPIRVLCVFSLLDRGGAESMCMDLYRNIDRSKVQFDFAKHGPDVGLFEKEILSLGGKIYEAPKYRIINHVWYCNWWKKHFKEHPEHKIVHGHFFTISAVYFNIAKKLGRTTVAHSNCTPMDRTTIYRKARGIVENYYVSNIEKFSDYCLSCSKDAGDWVFKNNDFQILNNAIKTSAYIYSVDTRKRIRKEYNIEDYFVLGAIGRIVHQKNPLGIVEIFSEVCKLRNDARLLWVGTYDTEMGGEAMRLAEELGVRDKIIFTGVVDNVYEMVQAMDCFIFPSFFEGLGIVAVEAQTAGLPCFISDVVPREVELTDLCTFLPLDDYSRWAEEIVKRDYSNRKSYHEQVAEAGYDIATTAKWLQDFYLSL